MSRRIEKNWNWIKAQYETGLPMRKIAALYSEYFPGESVSHQNVSAYAKRHGWSRGILFDSYRAETKRKVTEKLAVKSPQGRGVKRPDDGKSLEVHKAEVIALNSDIASDIEIKHKIIGNGILKAALEVLDEIQRMSSFNTVDRDGIFTSADMTPAAKAKILKDLVYVIDKAIAIERKSWSMDKQEGGGPTGVFKININVPDPKPLPEHFK